jgi:hypothetical protein
MRDPVLCQDGYTYERNAIMRVPNSISPMTRQPFDKSKLIPNRALKSSIDRFIASNTQVQSYSLGKQNREQESQKFNGFSKLWSGVHDQESQNFNGFFNLRNEVREQEKRESDRKIQIEESRRQEKIILEQIKQDKIRFDKEKDLALLAKHQLESEPKLIELIKNDQNTFFTNYKELVKNYQWMEKYIYSDHPFINFVFDEIIPNIDTIIDEISKELKENERIIEQMLENPAKEMNGSINSIWMQHQVNPKYHIISCIKSILQQYTHLKSLIPELKSKEYYIVNISEFTFLQRNVIDSNLNGMLANTKTLKYFNVYLAWDNQKTEIINSLIITDINGTHNIRITQAGRRRVGNTQNWQVVHVRQN